MIPDDPSSLLLTERLPTPRHSVMPLSPRYHLAATSDNTRRAYRADIHHFETWGARLPATADTVLRYLHAFADTLNPSTLSRRLTAIKQWHQYQDFPDPTAPPLVRKTLRGITRLHGQPQKKALPLLPEHLIQITSFLATQPTLAARRNNALLQLGFLGALRRSELVAIRTEHLTWHPEGLEILIPHSKTDPLHTGQHCVIPLGNPHLCAVRAVQVWIEEAGITEGFIFRRILRQQKLCLEGIPPRAVNAILTHCAIAAGLEQATHFSSHSMRRGLATTASRAGVSLPAIMRQGRWKKVETVIEYIEAAHRFSENAADGILRSLPDRANPIPSSEAPCPS